VQTIWISPICSYDEERIMTSYPFLVLSAKQPDGACSGSTQSTYRGFRNSANPSIPHSETNVWEKMSMSFVGNKSSPSMCSVSGAFLSKRWRGKQWMYLPHSFTFMWPCIVTNFLIIKPTRCTNFSNLFCKWNSTCFGQFLCPSSGVIHCTLSNGIGHTVFEQLERCLQTCMTYTIAECTVNNSWWWTVGLSETCRVSFQK
jgi:hypothetical protein